MGRPPSLLSSSIPLAISVLILVLNIKGHYIGASLPTFISSETIDIFFLQVAAKFQELMVIASLTTIIFTQGTNYFLEVVFHLVSLVPAFSSAISDILSPENLLAVSLTQPVAD